MEKVIMVQFLGPRMSNVPRIEFKKGRKIKTVKWVDSKLFPTESEILTKAKELFEPSLFKSFLDKFIKIKYKLILNQSKQAYEGRGS